MGKQAVIGIGNPLRGDDGVGPRVVEELQRRTLPENVSLLDGGTGGLGLLSLLENGWQRVILVDAADVGRAPGEFVRFTPDQVRMARTEHALSIHNAGLSDALALADALGRRLPQMVIFGVQPGVIGWREGLSAPVEAAVPRLVAAVLRELHS